MKQITNEWLNKAEADYHTMIRECAVEEYPNYDGICFHAQQCAEKYLKALLNERGIRFGKIHDLLSILEILLSEHMDFETYREDLAYLSSFAVSFRYPGESADYKMAIEAKKRCERVRRAAKKLLGI